MDGARDFSLIGIALIALVTFSIPFLVFFWSRRVAQRPNAPRWAGLLPKIAMAVAAFDAIAIVFAVISTVVALVTSTAERATHLAIGISKLMNYHGFAVVLSLLVALVVHVLSWRTSKLTRV